MSVGGNRTVETGAAATFDGEVAQEGSETGRHLLDRAAPARAGTIHEGAADAGCIPVRRIFPECRQQAGGVARVEPDRGVGRSAVLAQPCFEAGDQMRFSRRRSGRPAHTDLDEVPTKEPGTVDGVVIVTTALRAWATTPAKMLAEHSQIDVARQRPARRENMTEMRRRPQVSNGGVGAIALARERCCKAIEVRTARPAAPMFRHLRYREVSLQHDRPRL